uniref:HTH CENPB-type domain-containing protein n=1 Tax=Biomphalaria glabrata TaxID=6526 RepID=A0A2C9LK08_BIOGL
MFFIIINYFQLDPVTQIINMASALRSIKKMAGSKRNVESKKLHDHKIINVALMEMQEKRMSLRQASKNFNIPATTLHSKFCGKHPVVSRRKFLTDDEEDKLKKWLIDLSSHGFGKTNSEVRETAKAIKNARDPTAESNHKTPTKQWLYAFYKRHPELVLRTPLSLGKERAVILPTNVHKWFLELQDCINRIDPSLLNDPARIFNADESGFTFDPKSRRVIACKGSKHVYTVTSGCKTQVTVLACISAAGQYTPPLLIYPYKRIPCKNLLQDFPDALLQISKKRLDNFFHILLMA